MGAPSKEATRTEFPPLMKPIRPPSGEKNGLAAPSVPAMGVAVSWSSGRTQRRVPPSAGPEYTMRRPSGEMASRPPPLAIGGCMAWDDGSARLNWVSGSTGAGRSQPQSAATAETTATAPSAMRAAPGRRREPGRDGGGAAASSDTVEA